MKFLRVGGVLCLCALLGISSLGQNVIPAGDDAERPCLFKMGMAVMGLATRALHFGNPFRNLSVVQLNSLTFFLLNNPFVFLGFLNEILGNASTPLTVAAPIIGSVQVDRDFDGTLDATHNILAENQNSAFLDFNNNGTFNQDTDVQLSYESSDDTFHISNLTTTPSPGGQFQIDFLLPIFEIQEGTASPGLNPLGGADPLGLNLSMDIFSDVPQFQQLRLNKLLLINTVILPHVPFGVAGALQLATQIVVNNPFQAPVEATMAFSSSANGTPANVNLGGTTANRHVVTIPARSSRLFETASSGDIKLTWGYLHANQPLGVSSNFLTRDTTNEGRIAAEAGIAASGVDTVHILNISRNNAGVGTAVAMCNATNKNAQITLTLTRSTVAASAVLAASAVSSGKSFRFSMPQGVDEDQVIATATTTLNSQTQVARFFEEFFSDGAVPAGPVAGSLYVHSDTDVAVTSLKTVDRVQSSSLPAGSVGGQ